MVSLLPFLPSFTTDCSKSLLKVGEKKRIRRKAWIKFPSHLLSAEEVFETPNPLSFIFLPVNGG